MASRRKGRILAFQALYCWDANRSLGASASKSAEEISEFSWAKKDGENPDGNAEVFSRLLFSGAVENLRSIDGMIKKHLLNWKLPRLNRVDLAVLRLSVYSLMYQTEMHPSIVIDEAIGISKEFGTNDSYRFVNGVLDSVRKTLALK